MCKTKVLRVLLYAKVLILTKKMMEGLKYRSSPLFKFRVLVSLLFVFLWPAVAFAQSLFVNIDFSDTVDQLPGFYHHLYKEAGEPWSFTISDSVERDGNPSGRFELRFGDRKEGGSERTEISYNNITTSEVWVGFSLYLPKSWKPDTEEELTGQLHTWDTINKNADINPPVSIQHGNGFTYIKLVYSLNEHPNLDKVRVTDTLGKTITGQWVDYVIHAKYDVNKGFAQVWQNGKLVVNYSGPLGYKHCRLPVIKFGIYKWPWSEGPPSKVKRRIAYYDDIKIAGNKGSYDLVAPGPIKMNKLPIAKIKNNELTITLPEDSAILDGSPSKDSDGKIASYQWEQISGPSTSVLFSSSAAKTKVTDLRTGNYVFELTVKDDSGATSTSKVTITVHPPSNKPPIAKVKNNELTITLPKDSATLDGSPSSDSDGKIISYQWKQTLGPSAATIADINSSKTKVTGLKQGNYIFQLTIKDNNGATSASQVTVAVKHAPNKAPVAKVKSDELTITLPKGSITLDGSTSSDSDGKIISYQWKQTSGPAASAITDKNSAKTKVIGLQKGIYTFNLIVKDDNGATDSSEVKVTVNALNRIPENQQTRPVVGAHNQMPVKNKGQDTTITVQKLTAQSVILYPNPASNIIYIRLYNQQAGKVKVTIYDENGIVRQKQYFNKSQKYFDQTLDISHLMEGINFVQIQINNYTSTHKLMKIQ